MRARKIGLLILILGFGLSVETAYSVRRNLWVGPLGCRVLAGRFEGPSFSYEAKDSFEVAARTSLELDNRFGSVTVGKGAPGVVKVTLKKVVYLEREAEAQRLAAQLTLRTDKSGSLLRVTTNRDELERGEWHDTGFETHLTLELPPGTAVKLTNAHGALSVSDVGRAEVEGSFDAVRVERVAGAAEVRSSHGDVTVSHVEGPLVLSSRHGDVEVNDVAGRAQLDVEHGEVKCTDVASLAVGLLHGDLTAERVRGDLEVRAEHAAVQVTDVGGRAVVSTTHRDITVEHVVGEASLKAEHGHVRATDLKGALTVETSHDGIALKEIGGPVEARVSHGGFEADRLRKGARVKVAGDDVVIRDFAGPIEVEAQRAAVRLEAVTPIRDAISVTTTTGSISLGVPPGSRLALEATTQRGEVEVELPGLSVTRSERQRLSGSIGGGGPLVKLESDLGDVRVQGGSAAAER